MSGTVEQYGNLLESIATTATAGGTTTLVNNSARNQQFTGSSAQTVVLPDATTCKVGHVFIIENRSTGAVTVNFNGGSLAKVIAAGLQSTFKAVTIGTSAGTWDISQEGGSAASSTYTGTAGENLSTLDAVYIASVGDIGRTAGLLYKLNSANPLRNQFAGIVVSGVSSGATVTIQVAGEMSGFTGLLQGQAIYAAAPVQFLAVGGGGGGGTRFGGGGGGGGVVFGSAIYGIGSYTVTIGAGGAGNSDNTTTHDGSPGSNTVFDIFTAGGGGAGFGVSASGPGLNDGAATNGNGGGGTGGGPSNNGYPGGNGNGVGFGGGSGLQSGANEGGGGGGAGGKGSNGNGTNAAGNGGSGLAWVDGKLYGGGGGGGAFSGTAGLGGTGGGGNGSSGGGTSVAGTANTGGGGGAGGGGSGNGGSGGGSGVVVIRYITGTITATGGTITTDGNYTVHTFTSSGTWTVSATASYSTIPPFAAQALPVIIGYGSTTTSKMLINGALAQGITNSPTTGYTLGGRDSGGSQLKSIQRIIAATEATSTISATLVNLQHGGAGFQSNLKGYFAGGSISGSGRSTGIQAFTFSGTTSATLAAVLTNSITQSGANGGSSFIAAGYIIGGNIVGGSTITTINKLTFSSEAISTLGTNNSFSTGGAAVVQNTSNSYACGGFNGTSYLTTISKMPFSTEISASIAQSLGSATFTAFSVWSQLKGYIVDGQTGSKIHVSQFINFSNDTVGSLIQLTSVAKYEGVSWSFTKKGYFAGGNDDVAPVVATVYSLNFPDETFATAANSLASAIVDSAGVMN